MVRQASRFLLGVVLVACADQGPSLTCGPYPSQETSPHVLPYAVGQAFVVGQGNCSDGSHGRGTLVAHAYDFLMPAGTPVQAARGGVVLLVEDRFPDGTGVAGEENYVNIRHADGSIAAYVHLTQRGSAVAIGDLVAQGQRIGTSGNSGSSSEPHLHFHVQGCSGCATIPVTFRNTTPHPEGLQAGEAYLALPY